MDIELKKKTRKAITTQTSEVIFKKLNEDKFFGISKEVAIEVLKERAAKGTFKGDLSKFEKEVKTVSEKLGKKPSTKVVAAKEEKESKEPKVKGEKKEKSETSSLANKDDYPDFKYKFKITDKVEFTPFRQETPLKGKVVKVNLNKLKDEVVEYVIIRTEDGKNFAKRADSVKHSK